MATTTDQLQALVDRADLTDLIDRFLRGPDAVIAALATGMARFGPTQHLGANHVIDLHGDRATVRWNATQTHLPPDSTPFTEPFVSGGYYDGEVVRTADGWRFSEQEYHIVWLAGQPPLNVWPRAAARCAGYRATGGHRFD